MTKLDRYGLAEKLLKIVKKDIDYSEKASFRYDKTVGDETVKLRRRGPGWFLPREIYGNTKFGMTQRQVMSALGVLDKEGFVRFEFVGKESWLWYEIIDKKILEESKG